MSAGNKDARQAQVTITRRPGTQYQSINLIGINGLNDSSNEYPLVSGSEADNKPPAPPHG